MIRMSLKIIKNVKLACKKIMFEIFVCKVKLNIKKDLNMSIKFYFSENHDLSISFYDDNGDFVKAMYYFENIKPWEINKKYKETIKRLGA